MKELSVDSNQARKEWRTILDNVRIKRVAYVVTRYKDPVAVVLSIEDYEELKRKKA